MTGSAILLLSGCNETVRNGWMPGTRETTNQTGKIIDLWVGSWIAAITIGALVWALTFWCVVAYRRRRDDTGYPAQIRYHVPIEILYTVVPLMMVGVLFYYNAKDESAIADTSAKPDVVIGVVGAQWKWDFNYPDANVYEAGLQARLTGKPGVEKELPTLYLPVGKRVEFRITSRDVMHSFWVPAFLYKLDAIPGVENKFQIIPGKVGHYQGKCSELCGEYHSNMLFNVQVVSVEEFDAHMAALKAAGNVGQLSSNLGRALTPPGRGYVPNNPSFTTTAATSGTGS